jgi:hypothetical protein
MRGSCSPWGVTRFDPHALARCHEASSCPQMTADVQFCARPEADHYREPSVNQQLIISNLARPIQSQ